MLNYLPTGTQLRQNRRASLSSRFCPDVFFSRDVVAHYPDLGHPTHSSLLDLLGIKILRSISKC
jgi:hypothetical protein